ncbi:MAG: SIS domain-containing protein [Acidimicrobiales bacterium]|nr:SIS domain-containing protein [Acidimicrobiales bacterium]
MCFGNGGSSTDAASLASLFAHPPQGIGIPARTLLDDAAVLTAVGNDVGFDRVFSRQIIALGRAGDVALGISTSGDSRNLLEAFREARRGEMLSIGIAGNGGGAMADADLDVLLVVDADSVHRIQETQAAVGFELWRLVVGHTEHR